MPERFCSYPVRCHRPDTRDHHTRLPYPRLVASRLAF
jgi:hypothetical protein